MPDYYHSFFNLLFIGIVALFPVVNPIGSALMVNHYFSHLTKPERRRVVIKICLYAFFLCTVTLLAGHYILELFGITIPVIQLAGGIMICKTGWEFLSDNSSQDKNADPRYKIIDAKGIQELIFFPITFPITTGGGTMAVLFTLGAHSENVNLSTYFLNNTAVELAIIIMCILVYILYLNTNVLLRYAGSNGEKVINRIMAFLTFCVGLQIAATGLKALFKV